MTDPQSDPLDAAGHRPLAAQLFNYVWALLDQESRTAEQDEEMVHAAHASVYHWSRTGVADMTQRMAVGEWQCARVYAVLGRAEPALHHARRTLELAEREGVEEWVGASAYEAMARATRVAGDLDAFTTWRGRAREAAAALADEEDRRVIERDLASLEG